MTTFRMSLSRRALLAAPALLALPAEAQVGLEIGHGGALEAALPKELQGAVEDRSVVEGLGASHGTNLTVLV